MKVSVIACLLGLVLLAGGRVQASTLDIFGFNPRGVAMGGAMVAAANDYTAVYYNPGALTVDKRVHFGLGLTLTVPALYVDRELSPSDLNEAVLPTEHVGLTLGWQRPLGGVFEKRVALGLAVYLPLGRVVAVQGIDPQRPQFYMFQNLQDKLQFLASVAFEPLPWCSLGVGGSILADIAGDARLGLNIANQDLDERAFEIELSPSLQPVVGLHLRPVEGLAIGLVWRGATSVSFQLPVAISEPGVVDILINVGQTVLWSPDTWALGLSYRVQSLDLVLSVDASYALWSAAPDPSPRLSLDVEGELLEAFGLDDALDLSARTQALQLAFANTLTGRLGVEWEPSHWFRLRGGYFFRPTPAPRQTGTSAYLDNNAHVFALGAGFVFADPFAVHRTPVELDLALQWSHLPRRTVLREYVPDPIGDLSHGGNFWALSVAVGHRY